MVPHTKPDIYCLHTGPLGVNTYVITLAKNRVLVVDPADCAFSADEGMVYVFLKKHDFEPAAIILTHGHFDHVSGLPFLHEKYPSTPIVIHPEDKDYLGPQSEKTHEKILRPMDFSDFLPSVTALPSATAFLEEGKSLKEIIPEESYNRDEEVNEALSLWSIMHTPGHTKGSTCLFCKEHKLLVSGDTLFHDTWGRTDLAGGDEAEIQRSLRKIREYCGEDILLYPGH